MSIDMYVVLRCCTGKSIPQRIVSRDFLLVYDTKSYLNQILTTAVPCFVTQIFFW